MGDQRQGGISWTDETWNPIRGCSRVNASCINCYAEAVAIRFSGPGLAYEGLVRMSKKDGSPLGWNGKVRRIDSHVLDPCRWGRPRRVFVNSMSDLFHEDLPFEDIAVIFGVMAAAPTHTFQVLTKRPQRALDFFAWAIEQDAGLTEQQLDGAARGRLHCLSAALAWEIDHGDSDSKASLHRKWAAEPVGPWPLPNVHMGVSVGNQAEADEFVPLAIRYPASLVWVSQEPQHGLVVYSEEWLSKIRWIVVGGESGPGARPFHIDWARTTLAQGARAKVPVFVKQLGADPWTQDQRMRPLKDKAGGDPAEWPRDLQIQEFPCAIG